ncbi:syndrome nuclear autoantigen 1 [Perkinsus olseni]|uniref:Syndrome nuclear autoantigen 1 n=2 Tax=Perkinsus olseni TaxID=32597 RepID=A0A7J6TF15_PEROL|nr:syndrome nuclear autoantigen 1 [Perkinsus olseni]
MEVRLECACVQYCGLRCLGRDIVPLHRTVLTAFHHHIHNPSIVSIITTNAAAFDWASVLHPDEASLDTASICLLANLCLRACVVHGQDTPVLSSILSLLGRLCGLSPALPDRIRACLPEGLLEKVQETPGVEDFLNYNSELVKCIEDLREKREELNRQILKEEEDKGKIQKELAVLTDRLQRINESLVRKTQARNEYDKTIQETEAAYMKILESSQTLLHVLKRESVNLTKKKQVSD